MPTPREALTNAIQNALANGAPEYVEIPPTYQIVRYYQDRDTPADVIEEGVTLEYAQAHCQRDDTHGDGWFDGYRAEGN